MRAYVSLMAQETDPRVIGSCMVLEHVRAVRLRDLMLYLEIDYGHPDVSVPITRVDSLVLLEDSSSR